MTFRHFIAAFLSVVLLFSLSGCGEKVEKKKFNWSGPGTELTLTYFYSGDKVLRQHAKNKIAYASVGAKNKEEAMKVLDPISKKYQSIAGVEESVVYQDTFAEETLEVDFTKVNFTQLNNLQGTEFTGQVEDGISMKKSEELLKARGFKAVN